MHILSEFNRIPTAKDIGATAYLRKPLDKRDLDDAFSSLDKNLSNAIKNVLIVEDMSLHQEIVKNLLASHYVDTGVHIAKTVAEAINGIRKQIGNTSISNWELAEFRRRDDD